MMMKKTKEILSYFDELFPDAHCELVYHNDYELLIAVMLSAQTTDKSVNRVTEVLFSKYQNLDELASANVKDIENIIKSIGMYKNKADHIINIARGLIDRFNYKVPSNKEDLMSLSGVGNKTANVVRAELFKINELPVDTHVARIAKRLGYAREEDSPFEIEKKLKKAIDEDRQIKTHHQMIWFGRYFCQARNPRCEECKIRKYCNYSK
jgi:endonuclease-3